MGCTITVITAGQGEKYFDNDLSIGDYYAASKGEWQGKLAEKWGLTGEIKADTFKDLLHGKTPDGQQIQSGGNGEHRAGLDICFAPPKDITLLYELTGDSRLLDVHKQAVNETLKYIEKTAAQARETVDGQTQTVSTGNLVIAKFDHRYARPVEGQVDPQMHTHCVVMNITERPDGELRALSNELSLQNKAAYNLYYDARIAIILKSLGYGVQWEKFTDQFGKEGHTFKVTGFPQALRDEFSQRHDLIQESIKERGVKSDEGKKEAALNTRELKSSVDPEKLSQEHLQRAAAVGWTPEKIKEAIDKAKQQEKANDQEKARYLKEHPLAYLDERKPLAPEQLVRLAVTDCLERQSVFTKVQVIHDATKLALADRGYKDTLSPEKLEAEFDKLENGRELKNMGEKTVKVRATNVTQEYYSTPGMVKTEQQMVDWVKEGRNTMEPIMTPEEAKAFIAKCQAEKPYEFTKDQWTAAETILTTKHATLLVQGDAGTGKTDSLEIVRKAAEVKGLNVYGVSKSGAAAAKLEQATGIQSRTVDAFRGAVERGEIDTTRAFLVHDEASFLGSKDFYLLQQWARTSGVQAFHTGDVKQLPPIAAGNPFEQLYKDETIPRVELKETVRFLSEQAEKVAQEMAEKKVEAAFDRLEKAGKVNVIPDIEELKSAAVKDLGGRNYIKNIMVTGFNMDRRDLNQQVRETLQEKGEVTKEEYRFEVRYPKNMEPGQMRQAASYDEGDCVFVRKPMLGFCLGDTGKVIGTNLDNNTIALYVRGGLKYLPVIEHGANLSAFKTAEIPLAVGEKLVFLKNDEKFNVKNGQFGVIEKVNSHGDLSVSILGEKEQRTVDFNLRQYNYLDHGYAITISKSQGQTADHTVWFVPTGVVAGKLQGSYVAMTRGQYGTAIYTMDLDKLKQEVKEPVAKLVTLDFKNVNSIKAEQVADFVKTMIAEKVVMHFQDKFDERTNKDLDTETKSLKLEFETKKNSSEITVKEGGENIFSGPKEYLFDHTQREVLSELRDDFLVRDLKGMAREIDKVLGPEPKDNFLNLEPLRVSIKDHGLGDETHPGILKDQAEGTGRDWHEVLEEIRNDVNYVPPILIENSDAFEKTKADLWADRDRRVEQNRDSDRDTDKGKDGNRDRESDRDWTRDI